MKCHVLTLFPEIFRAYLDESILKRAQSRGLLEVDLCNIRDFSDDPHRKVDDYPFGGGAGMVLKPEPIFRAMESIAQDSAGNRVIIMSPQGRPFHQSIAEELSEESRRLVFICGRYEGIDERVKTLAHDEISLGDYVLTGGELAALAVIDASGRLVPGLLGDDRSVIDESFSWGLLDYPHYTRPRDFRGMSVPDVLLSGHHRDIDLWRRKQALKRTLELRPDLLEKLELSDIDRKLIAELKEED